MEKLKQLIENRVRVKFITHDGHVDCVEWFDLVITEQRRDMGMKCGFWQSKEIGNRVESEVMTIVRAV